MKELLSPMQLVAAVVYSVMGIAILWLGFVAVDKLTPYDLWKELIEKKNEALARVVGALAIGISIIVAASIIG